MDPADLNFPMRSGFNILVQRAELSEDEKTLVTAILMVFMEKAVRNSYTYVEAAGRRMVLPKDIILSLKHQALPSTGFWGTPDLMNKVQEMLQELHSDDEDDEDDEAVEGDEEAVEEEEALPWTEAPSSHSPLCAQINAVDAQWDGWEPDNNIARIVKDAINNTVEQFGLED